MANDAKKQAKATRLKTATKSFPCKCDHCDWTGTVGEAQIIEGKARCPKCKGSLAGNRPQDNIMDALHDCLDLDGNDFD